MKPETEYRPALRLIVDELPPVNKNLWLVSRQGIGYKGPWRPGEGVIAWCPLPDFTLEQKTRLDCLRQVGIDLTCLSPEPFQSVSV